jgi:dienelactone hydrolase
MYWVSGKYLATDSGKRDVFLRTSDKRDIEATAQIDPFSNKGVVLLHMKGGVKENYRELQTKLADAGFSSIAINFRGNVNSGTIKDKHQYLKPDNAIFQHFYKDALAAKDFMIRMMGVNPNKIGLIGGSVGASTAIRTAAVDPSFRAVALLSPGLTYLGVDSLKDMEKYPPIPTFITYATKAKNEDYSAVHIKAAHARPDMVKIRPVQADFEKGHASSAFETDPKLIDELVNFMVTYVR